MTQTSPRSASQTATNSHEYATNDSERLLEDHVISPPQQAIKPLELKRVQQEHQGVTRQGRGLSLRTKATALAIALGTLPGLIVGATAFQFANQSTYKQIIDFEQTIALDLEDKLEIFIRDRYSDIQIMAGLDTFTNQRLRSNTTPQEKDAELNLFIEAYGKTYDSIAVFDLDGNVLAQSKGRALPNHRNRSYFQAVLKTNRPIINEPEKSKSAGIYSIHIAAPMKDTVTGKTIAIIRARIPVESLTQILNAYAKQATNFYLVDSAGKVYASREKEFIGKPLKEALPKLTAQIQAAKDIEYLTTIDRHKDENELATYAATEGLREAPFNLKWGVVVSTPTDIAFASQRQLLLALLLGTGLTALLVSMIAAQLANRATRPILAAADTVEKLGEGKLDSRVAVEGKDELAVLGTNINLMASQLQDLLREKEAETEQTANLLTQIQASAKRLNKQNSVFVELSTNKALGSGDLNVVFQQITEATTQTLETERASVWLYNSDRSGIRCTDLYAKSAGHHSAGIELLAVDYPAYFKALAEERIIVANNAHTAPQTKEFSASYLSPLGITSMLNAQIRLGNQVVGVICCEHVGPSRQWALEEQNFVASMADTVALSMEAYERKRVEEELKTSEEQQRQEKQALQRRAMELLVEVDPVSKGDLTIRASVTEDEIGTIADSYNATIGNLRKIVIQVQAAATQVVRTTNSNEVSVSEVSKEALQQAKEIAVALSRIQEMSNSIRAVATSAAQAEAAVEEATQTVEAGDAAMNRTVKGILAIRETVTETSQKVKRLGESSQNISKVVNLIGTFAAQTNLLALKASIEAARAGEEGRGFAVLADEVRGLARQSAQATAEIESLVIAIQAETKEVAAAMETGSEQVAEGTKLVDETRQSLNKITAVSVQIGALVEAISAAAVVQSQASVEVTQTISDVAASANKNSNSVTLVSASFKELLAVATELQASASQFKVS